MDRQLLITDNVAEVLVKIIEFTNTRQKILTENLNNIHNSDFVPKDLAVDEFSELLHCAIDEHIVNKRLLLCDTENIKFGSDGSFSVKAIVDEDALEFFQKNKDRYIEVQISKLLENALNQRLAAELLRQKQQLLSITE
jgi:flagellar basal body rod protein FlgB